MVSKKPKKNRYNFLIDSSAYEEFSKICEEEGLVRSKHIENFIKEFVENHKKNKK